MFFHFFEIEQAVTFTALNKCTFPTRKQGNTESNEFTKKLDRACKRNAMIDRHYSVAWLTFR